ncbi:MAG: hypothetical protein ACFE0R_05665 [Salinarimonas sp.]
MQTVLLLGDYRPTLTLARDYARRGWRVLVAGRGRVGAAGASRAVAEVIDLVDADADPAGFLSGLEAILAAHPEIAAVIPVAEGTVRALADNAARLPQGAVWATPAPDVVEACLDKPASFRRARACDVPVAPFALVHDHAALLREAAAIGFPLVIRPLASTRRLDGEKALTIADAGSLVARLPRWPAGHEGLLLQRRVAGRRHNVYFAARRGTLIRACEAVIARTDRADGSGLAVDGHTIAPDAARLAHVAALVEDLGYTGIGCAQFLVDPDDGATWFLEINPRVAGNHAAPEAAGLELGRLAVALAAGDAEEERLVIGRAGLRYSWTWGDLAGIKALKASGAGAGALLRATGRMLATALASDVRMTWSWRDPGPTLVLYARAFLLPRRAPRPAPPRPAPAE